jgi:transposase
MPNLGVKMKTMDIKTLEELLGYSDIAVKSIEVNSRSLILHCHSKLVESICPLCLQKCSKVKSICFREVRDLSLLGKEVYLHLESRQFHCEDCKRYYQEQFSFVESKKSQTKRLEAYLYECIKGSCVKEVAVRENILWDVLQLIFDRYSKKEIESKLNYSPKRIGIDEFAYKKGKKDYAVVIVDLDRGCIWDVLEQRDKESLKAYFLGKGEAFCKGIEVVSCDMWEGFSNTAKEVFPNVEVVIDRFHFFSHCNKVLDVIRKELRKQEPNNEYFKAIKWLLYKAWNELTNSQRTTLLQAFRFSQTLRKAYFLKNELQNIFNSGMTKQEVQAYIEQWLKDAQEISHKAMNTFINTFNNWKNDILNFFNQNVSNGIVEGFNNGIKTLKRVAYGFRNFQHLRARILVKFI